LYVGHGLGLRKDDVVVPRDTKRGSTRHMLAKILKKEEERAMRRML
jgi:hypothetical protein